MHFPRLARTSFVLAIPLLLAAPATAQILTFDFGTLTGNEASAASNMNNIRLTASTITRGSGVAAAVDAGRFNSSGWTTSNSMNSNDHVAFTVTPQPARAFSITSIVVLHQRNSNGPRKLVLRSSEDGYSANLGGVVTLPALTSTFTTTFTFSLTGLTGPVTFRLYGYDADGSTNQWGPGDGSGNDIVVNGSTDDIVVVNGTCGNTLSIQDNTCGTYDDLEASIAISGLPTTLGASANQAFFSSVEMVITHTYNADLEIRLTSPGGTTRTLVTDKFGNGNNLGNPANCPTAVFRLQDGGSALSTGNTSNVTGTYAPQGSLAGFTGDPNGNWIITICDDEGDDLGALNYVKLNFQLVDCNGVPGGSAIPGSACDDGNACTINDVRTAGCGCAGTFQDTDSDGTCNANDGCPNDPLKIAPGICGCGVADTDTDSDGIANCNDNCPLVTGTIGSACNDGNDDTMNDVLTAGCVCAGSPAIFYSTTSGDLTANIWSTTAMGVAAPVTINTLTTIVVQNGHVVTVTGTRNVRNLTVNSGGTLNLGTGNLTVNGATVSVAGTINGGSGLLRVANANAATLSGAGTVNLHDLTVETPAGLNASANVDIRGTLLLNNGTYTSNTTKLVSILTGTGRLGPVAVGASYSGNLTVQRYIPAGATNWRMLGSPVGGRSVLDWKDDFFTAGFPGSHYPNFYDTPTGAYAPGASFWPSIRGYDEANTGTNMNDGVIGVAGLSTPLTVGKGFMAWSANVTGGTGAFVIDVTGPPTVAQSPLALPMSWTNTGTPVVDGWNMVSNPLPSPITFTAINRGANVQNAYWIFDPMQGNMVGWSVGVGQAGANGTIQSSQGFWLKANGAAVTTTVDESDKVNAPAGGVFGDEEVVLPIVRLNISSAINPYNDEATVVFANGTPNLDPIDALKFVYAHPSAPQIATRSADGYDLAIDFHGAYDEDIAIPVTVNAAVTGTYTISADVSGITNLGCMSLEDLASGAITPLVDGMAYSFTLAADADATVPRFLLHATRPMPFLAQDVTCGGLANGSASVEVGESPMDLTWTDAGGNVILYHEALANTTATIEGLAAGMYTLHVDGAACGPLAREFTIDAPFALEASTVATTTTTCPGTTDGTLDLMTMGGTAPYTYAWSNGGTEEDLIAAAGDYTLTITDGNACSWTSGTLSIAGGMGPVAQAATENALVMNGEVVLFLNTSTGATGYNWQFGDGSTSTEAQPEHVYALPGTYTVTLSATDGTCEATSTFDVNVLLSTGLEEVGTPTVTTGTADGAFWIGNPLATPVRVRVLDAMGRQMTTSILVPGHTPRMFLSTMGWSTGMYVVQATDATNEWAFKLSVVK